MDTRLEPDDRRFAERAIRRERLFLGLSLGGVAVALGLSAYYVFRYAEDPGFTLGPRVVLVLLILLNARQNLRQVRYARILRRLRERAEDGA